MCTHTVAVAEETGCLKDHISSYLKGDGLSVSHVAQKGMPKHPGKKPGERT